MNKNFIIIALGSNLGDKYQSLKAAISELACAIDGINCSGLYLSKALLPENSPKEWDSEFYNCVFYGYTNLDLRALFHLCLKVESEVSPVKKHKGSSAPRYIDIDIIAFNEEVVDSKTLKIPHPQMLKRDFVMLPLAEIMPDWKYPVKGLNFGKTALELAQKLGGGEIERLNLELV